MEAAVSVPRVVAKGGDLHYRQPRPTRSSPVSPRPLHRSAMAGNSSNLQVERRRPCPGAGADPAGGGRGARAGGDWVGDPPRPLAVREVSWAGSAGGMGGQGAKRLLAGPGRAAGVPRVAPVGRRSRKGVWRGRALRLGSNRGYRLIPTSALPFAGGAESLGRSGGPAGEAVATSLRDAGAGGLMPLMV